MPKPIRFILKKGVRMPIYLQEVDRLMSLISPLGIDAEKVEFCLPIKKHDITAVDKLYKEFDLVNKKPIVAICTGGKFLVNKWVLDNFAQVAIILQKKFKAQVLLIGGVKEKSDGKKIIKTYGDSLINFIDKTSYTESAEILKRCNLLIANDCGPVHLAAAVGTPVVGIYSSRNVIGAWHPWGNNHTILRNEAISCRFCLKTECETMQCIKGITVQQVIEACRKYL